MPVGRCSCRAVYTFDITGHNLGSAMLGALVYACGGDWNLAMGLLPEEGYQDRLLENYDEVTHMVIPGAAYEGRAIRGALFFVRLVGDLTAPVKEVARQTPMEVPPAAREASGGPALSRQEVEAKVMAYDTAALLSYAERDRRVLRVLQRMLYSGDRTLRWKVADILGQAGARVALRYPETVTRLVQGLVTSLTDTAASSWGSLDALGELISRSPGLLQGYVPTLYVLSRDRTLLVDVLRALEKIAERAPHLVERAAPLMVPMLGDSEPDIRAHGAVFLRHIPCPDAEEALRALLRDPTPVELYNDGCIHRRTVGDLASEALGSR